MFSRWELDVWVVIGGWCWCIIYVVCGCRKWECLCDLVFGSVLFSWGSGLLEREIVFGSYNCSWLVGSRCGRY